MAVFFRGLKEKYNLSSHGGGIYFATDTKEIIQNGIVFTGELPDKNLIEDVALNAEGDKIVVTHVDGSTSEIAVGSGDYESAIEDKTLAMPSAVGGIAKGTKLSDIEGKTINAILDDMLFPTVDPTFTAPTASIKFNGYAAIQEVGAAAPVSSQFTTGFSAGAINLNGVKQANRAGAQDMSASFIYYGDDAANTELPATVALGDTSYKYRAAYAEGPQPKNNKGGDYSSALEAGIVDSSAVTVNGTFPWFASTGSASAETPVVKQTLVAWNATAGAMSTGNFTVQPSGTLAQVFKLPRQVKTLQMLNTVSGAMDTIGTGDYNETTEVIDINGTEHTYYVYTYKGSTRGEVTLLAKF